MSTTPVTPAAAKPPVAPAPPKDEIQVLANKWKKKRGSLIMALHDLQGRLGMFRANRP